MAEFEAPRGSDRWLLRSRRLLTARLPIGPCRRPPVPAFVAASEQGAEHMPRDAQDEPGEEGSGKGDNRRQRAVENGVRPGSTAHEEGLGEGLPDGRHKSWNIAGIAHQSFSVTG